MRSTRGRTFMHHTRPLLIAGALVLAVGIGSTVALTTRQAPTATASPPVSQPTSPTTAPGDPPTSPTPTPTEEARRLR